MSLLLAALALPGLLPQASEPGHRKIYDKVVDSVVAIRARAPVLGERSGTGVVLSKEGLILTSYAICPDGSTNIRVWLKGPRLAEAELVATSRRDELALLRLVKPRGKLKPIEFGDSARVRAGHVSYTIGNAANSIINDDEPSLNAGIVSGLYRLGEERANSTYTGMVIETTAAVNVGMEGAPCLDAEGKMVGFVTLNFSPHRFLGAAIPIDDLKPVIARLKDAKPASAEEALPEAGEGYLGIRVKDEGGKVVVDHVDPGGPAARAGFRKGDVIVQIADLPVKSARDVTDRLKGLEAGSIVWLKVDLGGAVDSVKVTLEKKK